MGFSGYQTLRRVGAVVLPRSVKQPIKDRLRGTRWFPETRKPRTETGRGDSSRPSRLGAGCSTSASPAPGWAGIAGDAARRRPDVHVRGTGAAGEAAGGLRAVRRGRLLHRAGPCGARSRLRHRRQRRDLRAARRRVLRTVRCTPSSRLPTPRRPPGRSRRRARRAWWSTRSPSVRDRDRDPVPVRQHRQLQLAEPRVPRALPRDQRLAGTAGRLRGPHRRRTGGDQGGYRDH